MRKPSCPTVNPCATPPVTHSEGPLVTLTARDYSPADERCATVYTSPNKHYLREQLKHRTAPAKRSRETRHNHHKAPTSIESSSGMRKAPPSHQLQPATQVLPRAQPGEPSAVRALPRAGREGGGRVLRWSTGLVQVLQHGSGVCTRSHVRDSAHGSQRGHIGPDTPTQSDTPLAGRPRPSSTPSRFTTTTRSWESSSPSAGQRTSGRATGPSERRAAGAGPAAAEAGAQRPARARAVGHVCSCSSEVVHWAQASGRVETERECQQLGAPIFCLCATDAPACMRYAVHMCAVSASRISW